MENEPKSRARHISNDITDFVDVYRVQMIDIYIFKQKNVAFFV